MADLYAPILNAVQWLVQTFAFTLNAVLPVKVLKEPVSRDQLDTATPFLAVCPCQGDGTELWAAGPIYDKTYGVQVALVAAGNVDLVSNLNTWLQWRAQIMRALRDPTALQPQGLTQVWRTEVLPDDPLDRGLIPQGLDFSSVRFRFHTLDGQP